MTQVPSAPVFSHFDRLPSIPEKRVAIRLTKDALRQVRGDHPWVYDQAITSIKPADAPPGWLGVIFDDNRRFVAIGLYDPDSPIRLRVLHRGAPTQIDDAFWHAAVQAAAERRATLLERDDVTGVRHLHGENDGVGGLIVDEFSKTFVVKVYTPAWLPYLPSVLAALVSVHRPERIVLRLSRNLARSAEADRAGLTDGIVVFGSDVDGPIEFLENGLTFLADVLTGQKTGHFLDQRDNRAFVAKHAAGKEVLDVFSCTGGFAVHAAAAGATSVHVVDRSAFAIETAQQHFDLNCSPKKTTFRSSVGDAFDVLAELAEQRRQFDVVVVDPPAFASRTNERSAALRSYTALADLALDVLAPGGRLFQASCSTRVMLEDLESIITQSASRQGRRIHSIETFGHAIDHPVTFPQGRYLDAVSAIVE